MALIHNRLHLLYIGIRFLCIIHILFNGNGKLELMTKVDMKQKLGIPSPNLADSLMMCMHCPEVTAQPDYSNY